MKNEGNKTFFRVTQQMIYDKLIALEEKSHLIHEQTTRTNGRVTHLEKTSVGLWVEQHPYYFAGALLFIVVIIFTTDSLKSNILTILQRFL